MNLTRTKVLRALDVEKFYSEVEGLELTPSGDGQVNALCPFHEDSSPSLNIRTKDGVFKCFGCDKTGSVFDFYILKHELKGTPGAQFKKSLQAVAEFAGVDLPESAEPEALIEEDVHRWHDALLKHKPKLTYLQEKRGLTLATVKKNKLGWDGERLTIPIYDADHNLVNIRKYLPDAKDVKGKMIGVAGHNGKRLMFLDVFKKGEPIILCEGEMDTLLARQLKFNATTVTSGAGNWEEEWTPLFKDEEVVLSYDNDKQGQKGTSRVGKYLATTAKSVRAVAWPEGFPNKGDVTDFIVELSNSAKTLSKLYEDAPPFLAKVDDDPNISFPMTDLGNAERFVAAHHPNLRYIEGWKDWIVWNGSQRWEVDELLTPHGRAAEVVRGMLTEAEGLEDAHSQEALFKWEKVSEAERKVAAMVTMAKPKMAEHLSNLNRGLWDYNTPNGLLNLQGKEMPTLAPHDRERMITLISGTTYDPNAKSELWEKFLDESTGGDKELLSWLQKAVGYSLTGDTREEVMFLVHGPTATGKSTFLEAVRTALGDYAATVDVEAFLAKRFSSGGPAPELAKLRWTRMVISVEVDQGKSLAESLIKVLTGGDEVSVRGLYKDPESFKPRFKIWIAANNRPKVNDADDAIWRRIIVVPFTHQVPAKQRNKTLKVRLTSTESPAVLAWAIRGCIRWQEEGLGRPPGVVEEALAAYRTEMDPLAPWMADAIRLTDDKFFTQQAELYASYASWAKVNGQKYPLTGPIFYSRLDQQGLKLDTVKGLRVRRGILLVTEKKEGGY